MASRSLPRRAATFAAAFGVTAVVGTVPAFAATQPSENIFGSGSSLQKIAQQNVFTAKWNSTPADRSTLSGSPVSNYNSTGSGPGLAEFGNTTGSLDPTQNPIADDGSTNGFGVPVLDAWAGSDDPPTGPVTTPGTNLADASAAATGSATTAVDEVTIPALQAPLAMIVSLPTGITVGPNSSIRLKNTVLQSIWDANVAPSTHYPANTWGAVLQESGLKLTTGTPTAGQFSDAGGSTGGQQAVTLEVRYCGSGTTYTFKGFLNLSGDANYNSSYVNDNDQWPVPTTNTGPNGTNCTNTTMVANTTATPGSISYPGLADANAGSPAYTKIFTATSTGGTHQIAYALVQDNYGGTGNPVYASPQGSVAGTANVYTGNNININGANPSFVGHWVVPLTGTTFDPTGSWGGSEAADPDVYDHSVLNGVKAADYPIVGVSFELGWTDYDEAGSNLVSQYGGTTADATAAGNTASSLLKYEVSGSKGQVDLVNAKIGYGKLPSKIDSYASSAANAVKP